MIGGSVRNCIIRLLTLFKIMRPTKTPDAQLISGVGFSSDAALRFAGFSQDF